MRSASSTRPPRACTAGGTTGPGTSPTTGACASTCCCSTDLPTRWTGRSSTATPARGQAERPRTLFVDVARVTGADRGRTSAARPAGSDHVRASPETPRRSRCRRPDRSRRAGFALSGPSCCTIRHHPGVAPAGRAAPHGRGAAAHRPPRPRQPGSRRRAGRRGRRAGAPGRTGSTASPTASVYEGFSESPLAGRDPPASSTTARCSAGQPPGAAARAVGRRRPHAGPATFGSAYEGPPGCVHGGYVAAAFDEVLGSTQSLAGRPGMTARLTVNYRSPTPLHTELTFAGRVVGVEAARRSPRAPCTPATASAPRARACSSPSTS